MPANLKVWIVVIEPYGAGKSGGVDHVFYREDDAQSRKNELNDKYARLQMDQYAYVAERNVF